MEGDGEIEWVCVVITSRNLLKKDFVEKYMYA
jgi:hypothetical protein